MTLRLAAAAVVVLFCITGCDRSAEPVAPHIAPETPSPAAAGAPTPDQTPVTAEAAPAGPVPDGAPAFAALYPGARVEGQPVAGAGDEAGPGGLVTFTTPASPDDVVAFYRERAEAAGLRSVTGMNQGEARAYGAAGDRVDGPSLQVVAAPTEAGDTSVQLSWSAGQ